MATLVLSAAGAAFGGGLGGSLLGATTMALGKAAGAALGSLVDQRLLGAGSAPVETGQIDRFRVMGSSEGAPLPRCFGRVRLPGQIIWSSRFLESVSRQDVGGKGTRGGQRVNQYSYSISLAVALCEGEVYRIGRIWADGQPVDQSTLTWRLHKGSEDQEPDPVIAAVEGADRAPAYRGTAYVVIEELDLTPYGNRIPQFNFEVFRRPKEHSSSRSPALDIRAVALMPGTGEYALATEPVVIRKGRGRSTVVNVNNDRGIPDVVASLDQMEAELPECRAVSLVVSWFCDDLRVDRCSLYPAVEQKEVEGAEIPWQVAGVNRSRARAVNRMDDLPLFGGTPADETVMQTIRHMAASGKAVMFYPFILMDIIQGNGLDDPWRPGSEQPAVPWRGRMTLSRAPGAVGSPDQTEAAAAEVDAFFGAAEPTDFDVSAGRVVYSGPPEWSYRRFVLHYAALCAAAGGVDSFCVGTEMRGLTQIRDGRDTYPAVRALRRLAGDVRRILGAGTKIGYAADWSEYFGHQPADGSGDVLFHLDELWADPSIDFVGIDNYMPLSDWRDGEDHLDAFFGSIYNLDYLKANVAGGEGFDWYYADPAARERQSRTQISDGAYGEHWSFRYKDLSGWWSNSHFNRIGGVREEQPTAWIPCSKPFWFTELGCPAVDKGTNQPNVFFDPKSSESLLPHHSRGSRDDEVQQAYISATLSFWKNIAENPISSLYNGRMVDLDRCFVWAWDARPWPDFPLRSVTWADGPNHHLGHWLNGRIGRPRVADIINEICMQADCDNVETNDVYGLVTGYALADIQSARQSLQPLLLAHSLDVHAAGSRLRVRRRKAGAITEISPDQVAYEAQNARLEYVRSAPAEIPNRVSLSFVQDGQDYQPAAVEAILPNSSDPGGMHSALPLVIAEVDAQCVAERWLHEARVAQDTLTWRAALSSLPLGVGDTVVMKGINSDEYFRIDSIIERGCRELTAVRFAQNFFRKPAASPAATTAHRTVVAPGPAHIEILDLPVLRDNDWPHAPFVAALKIPWAGPIAVYASEGSDYRMACVADRPAAMGRLLDPLPSGEPGLWMRHSVRVRMDWGVLSSRAEIDVLSGLNSAALRSAPAGEIEILQFLNARLVDPGVYEISGLLRGQVGTDFAIPPIWEAGTDFFCLDSGLVQMDIPESWKDLDMRVRAELAGQRNFFELTVQPKCSGLRPYRPGHLRAQRRPDGALHFSWVRRTRVQGDSWNVVDVPLGEERLLFNMQLTSGSRLLRAEAVADTEFVYSAEDQVTDGASSPLTVEVAQVSAQYGEGPFSRIIVDD